MAFADYIYESGFGVSFQIRLDTDQATVAGAVAGQSDVPAHVRVSSTRRQFGVLPRHIVAKRLVGAAPNQKTLSTRVAICTEAAYDALAVGGAISINGNPYTIGAKIPELTR